MGWWLVLRIIRRGIGTEWELGGEGKTESAAFLGVLAYWRDDGIKSRHRFGMDTGVLAK